MDFSNPLVNILLCRGYGKGRLQNMKVRDTVNMIWGVKSGPDVTSEVRLFIFDCPSWNIFVGDVAYGG